MSFDFQARAPRRIAVIGGGISGMAAAHLLADQHRVTLFEAAPRLGGHARTIVAGRNGDQPVDTGFIVFNHTNYPHLTALFDRLDVPTAPSDMSFGVSIDGGRIEYALNSVDAIFAQRRNALRPAFVRMIRDMLHWNKHAPSAVRRDPSMTIGDLLADLGLGDWFRDYYLTPFSGAIWSTPKARILDFPAWSMVRFFENHALLGYTGQHQWHTVQGGSVQYVDRLQRAMEAQGVEIRLKARVDAVRRTPEGVTVATRCGILETYDEVVFASHSDQALAMLTDPSPEERRALSAVRYQPNDAILHADASLMPRRRKCWASWVYTEGAGMATDRIGLTYWMNSLQPIPDSDPMFVTLNATRPIREELIYDQTTFHHPVYDGPALEAQRILRAGNGTNRTWFCGAWMKNGFHEDGFASAVDVVEAMQARETRLAGPAKAIAAE